MSHKCHAYKCEREIPPKLFMCLRHWRMLPPRLKADIWKHYRPGQENDKNPSNEYVKAAQRAVGIMILIEGGITDPIKQAELLTKMVHEKREETMKVNEVKYVRRIPREEYGYEEVAIAASPEKKETADDVLKSLKTSVETALESAPAREAEEEELDNEPEAEEPEEETEEESEEGEEDGNEEEEQEEEESDKGKKGKKVRTKAAVYDRSDELHKKLFAEHLTKIDAKWKSSDKGKAKAKKISEQLDGDEFIDKNGELVPAFLIAMRKAYKGK